MSTDTYGIPKREQREFLALREPIRKAVHHWLVLLISAECHSPMAPKIRSLCKEFGHKEGTFYGKLNSYRRFGWRSLINRAKYPSKPAEASQKEFRNFLYHLWLGNRKNCRDAHRQLLAIWRQGAPVPGYKARSPDDDTRRTPNGWTYYNINYQLNSYLKNHPEMGVVRGRKGTEELLRLNLEL